jgi:conjugative relaxase-like TrwC/TraI family protein
VLSIGKLNQQMADYYERAVADSREDYYALRGETEGMWWGRGAEALELRGAVEKGQLALLVAFRDPAHPEASLGRPPLGADQVGAYDLTFSAPKSVSILYALASPEIQQEMVAAHDEAVRDGLTYMEDHACFGRRGSASKKTLRQVQGDGFIAALYRHRVSRPVDMPDGTQRVDPQLHTHCIVANRTRSSEDGSWGALDGKHAYRLACTSGHTYQARLRDRLTERLGVSWTPVVNGQADIPLRDLDKLVDAFSSRRRQIRDEATQQARDLMVRTDLMTAKEAERHIDAEAAMRMLGSDGMRVATLASRQTKGGVEGTEGDLRLRWARQAAELGVTPDALEAAMGRVVRPAMFTPDVTADRLLAELTERVSTFTRHDAVRAVAQHAPSGASRAELEAAVDEVLADPLRVRTLHADRNGDVRYTTPEVQEAETRLVETVRARVGEGTGVLSPGHVDDVLAVRPELLTANAEQADMVRRLAGGGAGVATVIGPAGTGKTKGLEAYVAAAKADGRHVVGAAFTGAAAELLEGQTRAPSYTVHKLLGGWRDEPMPAGAVVIVDEAGQLNRTLTGELVELAARDRTKLVLAGDPKQMQPMDSGGPFRVIDEFTPATDRIELTVNRRQRDAAERRQLALLRAGETGEAVEGYMRHGQVVEAPDGAAVRMRMVADWWEAYHGGKDTLLLGRRHVDVDLLNKMARQRCVQAGTVAGPEVAHQGGAFQAGDEVICLKNDNRRNGIRVRNGMRGRVGEVDPAGRRIHVTFRGGQERWIPLDSYPDVAHGWAMTVEKAQGQTVDCAFVMRPAAAGHEWHYTALSRGREPVKYYLVDRHPDRDVEGTSHAGERDEGRTMEETLASQWGRVEATELCVDFDREEVSNGSAEAGSIADRSASSSAAESDPEAPATAALGVDGVEAEAATHRCSSAEPAEIVTPTDPDGREEAAESAADQTEHSSSSDPALRGRHDPEGRPGVGRSRVTEDMAADEHGADQENRAGELAISPTPVPSPESRSKEDAASEPEVDQLPTEAFDAQLDREREELEAEDEARALAETTNEMSSVSESDEPTHDPRRDRGAAWRTEPEIGGSDADVEREATVQHGPEM